MSIFKARMTNAAKPLLASALLALAAGGASALEISAHIEGPVSTAQGQGMLKFGEVLSDLTDGELTVKVFPDAQLGTASEAFELMTEGQIGLVSATPGYLSEFVPSVQRLVVPFVFRDRTHWEAVINGPIGAEISAEVKDKSEAVVLGYFGGSIRNLVSSKEVASLDDMAGLKVRLHPAAVQVKAWQSVGINPTVMAYGEIYSGLQLGVVDGLENESEWVLRMKFYEQAKYYVQTQHEYVTRLLLFSEQIFDGLTPDQQAAVLEAGKQASAHQRMLEAEYDSSSMAELRDKHGVSIVEIDKAAMQAKVAAALEPVIADLDLVAEVAAIRNAK